MTRPKYVGIYIKATNEGFKKLIGQLNTAAAEGYTLTGLHVVDEHFAAVVVHDGKPEEAPTAKKVFVNFFDDGEI